MTTEHYLARSTWSPIYKGDLEVGQVNGDSGKAFSGCGKAFRYPCVTPKHDFSINLIKWMLLKMVKLLSHLFYIKFSFPDHQFLAGQTDLQPPNQKISSVTAIILIFSILLYMTFLLDPLQSRH